MTAVTGLPTGKVLTVQAAADIFLDSLGSLLAPGDSRR
ncbi:hypothetical protein SUDANB58_02230 [Streptomyces sp. enrichment culture]